MSIKFRCACLPDRGAPGAFGRLKGVAKMFASGYNSLEVINMAVAREYVKALIGRLTDEQVQ
ncbi:MAG: hypothetical protein HPY90_14865, partial [Syntrophothermus sp.]|nr:hypothetical protein [Syntrophothermus sp.]